MFGSISDGVFHGKIVSPRDGAWFVEKSHYYFPPHERNDTVHSIIYHENDVEDPYQHVRQGTCSIASKKLKYVKCIYMIAFVKCIIGENVTALDFYWEKILVIQVQKTNSKNKGSVRACMVKFKSLLSR